MIDFLLTFLIGLGFGYAFYKLKVPGGMMVGAIVGAALLNISFSAAHMPEYVKVIAQITAGAFIGCSIEKEDVGQLKSIWIPVLILLSSLFFLNISVGLVLWALSPLDLLTAFMCCIPGGMSDIPIIAADMGANAPQVAVMQFARLVAGIGIFPALIGLIGSRNQKNIPPPNQEDKTKNVISRGQTVAENHIQSKKTRAPFLSDKKKIRMAGWAILTVLIATTGGLLGMLTGLPGGMLLFSMAFTVALKVFKKEANLPMWLKRLAQVLAGTYVGCSIFLEDILSLYTLILPVGILLTAYLINSFVVGLILHKWFRFPLVEGMLAATPAGAADMALISGDLGVGSARLVVMHVIRLLTVVALFPQADRLITLWIASIW